MIDGKMQDDATWKQAKVLVDLARLVAAKDPDNGGAVRAMKKNHKSSHERAFSVPSVARHNYVIASGPPRAAKQV